VTSSLTKRVSSLAVAVGAAVSAVSAGAETIITWTGSDDFDVQQSIHVAFTDASQLVEVIGPGTYGQTSGVPQTVQLSVRTDGAFIPIDTSTFGAHGALSSILPAATFREQLFSQIELTALNGDDLGSASCAVSSACFQDMTGTEFVFAKPGEVVWTGDSSATVSETLMFDPIRADGLAAVQGSGVFTQAPGFPQDAILRIHLNGQWVTIDTGGFDVGGSLAQLFRPTTFANGIVDGIEVSGGVSYGAYSGAGYSGLSLESFQFRLSTAPEPSTWAMMLAGIGLAGSALRRRRNEGAPTSSA